MYNKRIQPEGWVEPPPLKLDEDPSNPSESSQKVSAQQVAHTPANQGPLGHSEQQLFDGFTFTAENDLKEKAKKERA